MQRESASKNGLQRANQSSTSPTTKDNGQLEPKPPSKESLENAEVDLKNIAPDGVTAPIPESSQPEQDEHKAKTCRETQYRDLYLRAKEDYEKLSTSYLKLKHAHVASRIAFRKQEMYVNDILYQLRKIVADTDTTALKNKYQSEVPRASSLNLLLSSFSHPTSEAFRPSVTPPSEPHNADQTPDRGRGTQDAAVENVCKDFHRSGEPADQAARKLVPLQELQAKQGFTKFPQNLTAWECLSENDSDEPIVISERSLKRKRPGNKRHNASDGGLIDPVRIKSEPELSSPHSTLAHQSLTKPHDSIDLDDVGDATVTPRKRRRVWACLYGEDDMSCTRKDEGGVRVLSEAPEQTNYLRSPKGRVGHHSRTPDSPLKSRRFNQNRMCDSETTPGRNVLGDMDPNRRMLPNLKDPTLNQNCAIQIPPISHGQPHRDERHSFTEPKWSAEGAAFLRECDGKVAAGRPNLPPLSSHFEIQRKHEKSLSALTALEPPVNRLYPEDFQINPQHNQGLNYAFSEVIRGRDARKCLNGCTRPDCCGTLLRKAIEIGGYTAPQPNRLFSAINGINSFDENEAEEEQDQHLLEEYLGDNKHQIRSLSESQRKELLLQAKTATFAKLHGKHRVSGGVRGAGAGAGAYAGGRASTPPGFWNADMPTTQEDLENREFAKEMERQKVEQMYREAMRPNGRYLLR